MVLIMIYNLARRWTSRREIIEQWAAVIYDLTKEMANMLYVEEQLPSDQNIDSHKSNRKKKKLLTITWSDAIVSTIRYVGLVQIVAVVLH